MTIAYKNTKGVEFSIDVRLLEEAVHCIIQVTATREPYLAKRKYTIPYAYDHIIPPFDFNGTEEEIKTALQNSYKNARYTKVREEDVVDIIDIVMAENVALQNMQIVEPYEIKRNVGV